MSNPSPLQFDCTKMLLMASSEFADNSAQGYQQQIQSDAGRLINCKEADGVVLSGFASLQHKALETAKTIEVSWQNKREISFEGKTEAETDGLVVLAVVVLVLIAGLMAFARNHLFRNKRVYGGFAAFVGLLFGGITLYFPASQEQAFMKEQAVRVSAEFLQKFSEQAVENHLRAITGGSELDSRNIKDNTYVLPHGVTLSLWLTKSSNEILKKNLADKKLSESLEPHEKRLLEACTDGKEQGKRVVFDAPHRNKSVVLAVDTENPAACLTYAFAYPYLNLDKPNSEAFWRQASDKPYIHEMFRQIEADEKDNPLKGKRVWRF